MVWAALGLSTPAKVISDSSKPLMEGGLGPGGTSSYMLSALTEASDALDIDFSTPFDDLPKKARTALRLRQQPVSRDSEDAGRSLCAGE